MKPNNDATFAPCRDETKATNELRSANHDATRANVGDHVAFRLAETSDRLAQIWLVPPGRFEKYAVGMIAEFLRNKRCFSTVSKSARRGPAACPL
jgi:hypothetical protein